MLTRDRSSANFQHAKAGPCHAISLECSMMPVASRMRSGAFRSGRSQAAPGGGARGDPFLDDEVVESESASFRQSLNELA